MFSIFKIKKKCAYLNLRYLRSYLNRTQHSSLKKEGKKERKKKKKEAVYVMIVVDG